jgi:hypothetical protein
MNFAAESLIGKGYPEAAIQANPLPRESTPQIRARKAPCSAYFYKLSMFQHQYPRHAAGQLEIMSRDKRTNPLLRYEAKKFGMHLVSRFRVQIAGWLIGEEQQGFVGKGPGDRHSLLFAARELRRPMIKAVR